MLGVCLEVLPLYKVKTSHIVVVVHTCIYIHISAGGQTGLAKAGHVLNSSLFYTTKNVVINKKERIFEHDLNL